MGQQTVNLFQENTHYGNFNLVILNFGKSIYDKFKDPNCPNPTAAYNMKQLSDSYNKRFLFSKEFEEENLWTLFSLQDGVTSVAGKKRGGGSIRFIESFFNLKGSTEVDNESKLVILSGGTVIEFDGTYGVVSRVKDGETFKMMTFNESGNINEKPDKRFVHKSDYYFPGTVIVAKIRINEDDTITLQNG